MNGLIGAVRYTLRIQGILKTHDTHADGSVLQVGFLGLGHGVVIDVDYVVQHAHGSGDGFLQFFLIEAIGANVLKQIYGAQVTDRDLVLARVQGDLRTQVGRVDSAHVLLGRTHIAAVFKSNPGVSGFEQHGDHLAPQVAGLDGLVDFNFSRQGLAFILQVSDFKFLAVDFVQVRGVIR